MSKSLGLKEIEEFPRRIKIFLGIFVSLFLAGTLGFKVLTQGSLNESFIRTLETLAFMFEDNSPIQERLLEIFLAIVGVFLIWWILWSLADMLLDGNLGKYLKTRFYNFKLKRMKNHVVIIGGGRSGEEIAKVLSEKKQSFVIVESNPDVVETLKKKYTVINGNAEQEEVLIKAGIQSAKKVIITLPKTELNVMITLTVKELNPQIEVYARCENSKMVSKLKKAGAKVAVVPEVVLGDKLAESLGI